MSIVPNLRPITQKGAPKRRTKAQRGPTEAERAHMARVAELGCVLCWHLGWGQAVPCEVHHQRTGIGAGKRASHYQTLGLCWTHHRGPQGIHGMGRKAFEKHHCITELRLLAMTLMRLES